MAYKCLVRPLLEFACTVWNPHTAVDKATLESVQLCAACWACGSRWSPMQNRWSKSSDDCLHELRRPTLSSRRNYQSVSTMYDILHGHYNSLNFSDYCSFNSSSTCAYTLSLIPLQSTINSYT